MLNLDSNSGPSLVLRFCENFSSKYEICVIVMRKILRFVKETPRYMIILGARWAWWTIWSCILCGNLLCLLGNRVTVGSAYLSVYLVFTWCEFVETRSVCCTNYWIDVYLQYWSCLVAYSQQLSKSWWLYSLSLYMRVPHKNYRKCFKLKKGISFCSSLVFGYLWN